MSFSFTENIYTNDNSFYYQNSEYIPHLNNLQSYINLNTNLQEIKNLTPVNLFNNIQNRKKDFSLTTKNIKFDYALQPITQQTIYNLCKIAKDIDLQKHIDRLFSGENVNTNENKAALHTALRADKSERIYIDNKNVIPEVLKSLNQILTIASLINQNKWFKNTNKKVTDIVNVGIGGSDLGPKMAVYALQEYQKNDIKYHFLTNNDPKYLKKLLKTIKIDSTIFIINSKSFTTTETITNLKNILSVLGNLLPIDEHIIAVTSNIDLAHKYAIKHILPIWDWVGGRYSFCSAVNLILAIMIGKKNFLSLLKGAKAMDNHFLNTPYQVNIPVISALLEIWNINFFKSNSHLLLTYAEFLKYLPDFLQQLEMESNGKSTSINNETIKYKTSPITWGGLGSHAEHAYYQLIIQGTHFNTIDYFFVGEEEYNTINDAAIKKINAISKGVDSTYNKIFRHGINLITVDKLNPESLGSLIAMYEHKTFCEGILWNINSFDQPGVTNMKYIVSKDG